MSKRHISAFACALCAFVFAFAPVVNAEPATDPTENTTAATTTQATTVQTTQATTKATTVATTTKAQVAKLSATLSADKTSVKKGSDVRFTLTIKNDSSISVSNLLVTDSKGNTLKNGASIGGNSEITIEFTAKAESSMNVKTNISGKDANGNNVAVNSNQVAIAVEGSNVSAKDGLTAVLYADKTELETTDDVVLTIELQNNNDDAYTNISVIDKATNQTVQTLVSLDSNETKTYELTVKVSENTKYQYQVTASYEDGTEIDIETNELEITVGAGGFAGMGIIFIVLGVLAGLVAVTGIILAVLNKKEKEQKREMAMKYSEKYKKEMPKKTETKEPVLSSFTIAEDDNKVENAPELFNDELVNTQPIEPVDVLDFDLDAIDLSKLNNQEPKKMDYNDLDPDNM